MFLLLITAFLWKPLTGGGLYGPFDILHSWPLVKGPASPPVKNIILSDVAIQILPFIGFNKSELKEGRIPLWNPYSGWGAPHLGNGQSGVFSPFVLPMYVFDWRWGVIGSVYLRLFTAGFFTYLLLRRLGASFWPAVSAGTLYMFSGTIMVWLLWQNSAVAAMLPVTIHAAERLLQMPDRAGPRVWLAAVLAAGMYSGHPELFFFVAAGLVLHVALRVAMFPEIRARWFHHASRVAASCAIGVLLSAPQILPFAEYLKRSVEATKEDVRHAALPCLHWTSLILQFQPDLFGNPSEPYDVGAITNYSELNSGYAGAGAYLLLGMAVVTWWWNRSRLILMFFLLYCGWFLYCYDPLLLYPKFLHRVPLIGMPVPKRAATFGLFVLACIGGLTLDWMLKLAGSGMERARRWRLQSASIGAVLSFWALWIAVLLFFQHRMGLGTPAAKLVLTDRIAVVCLSLLFLSAWFLIRAGAESPGARFAFLLPVAFYLQTGYHMRGYTPTVPVSEPAGRSRAFDEIHKRLNGAMAAWEAESGMFSAINMWYRLRMPSNYDAMGVRDYELAANRVYGADPDRYIHLFGLRYVVTKNPEPFKNRIDTLKPKTLSKTRIGGKRIVQGFRAEQGRLNSVKVPFTDVPAVAGETCAVGIEVAEQATGKVIARRDMACSDLSQPRNSWVRFPRIDGSQFQVFQLRLDGSRVPADSSLAVATSPDWSPGIAVEAAAGTLGDLDKVWEGDGFYLFRVREALPRFQTFGSAVMVPDVERAYQALTRPEFEPHRRLVIEGAGPGADSAETVEPVVAEDAVTRIRLKVNRPTPGWLLALQPYYPGWSATVNGISQPLLRANACFTAVAVPAGESEVVLTYAPASFRLGLLGCLTGIAICLIATRSSLFRRRS